MPVVAAIHMAFEAHLHPLIDTSPCIVMPVSISEALLTALAPAAVFEPRWDRKPLASAGALSRVMPFTVAKRTVARFRIFTDEKTHCPRDAKDYHAANQNRLAETNQSLNKLILLGLPLQPDPFHNGLYSGGIKLRGWLGAATSSFAVAQDRTAEPG